MAERDGQRQKLVAAGVSIASNTTLIAAKLIVWWVSGSVSVLSEAINSSSDLLASLLAFFSIRTANAPADVSHPYGHGKAESLSSFVQALLIFGGGAVIIVESVRRLMQPAEIETGPAMGVMAGSVVLNVIVSTYLLRTAKRTESLALKADGLHLRTDVMMSTAVFVGLALVRLTGAKVCDPVAALLVSALILYTAWHLLLESVHPLMDARLPGEEVRKIRKVLQDDDRVKGYHKLRTRRSGGHRYADVHVQLADNLGLVEAHDITENLEDKARAAVPNLEITIHTEPYEAEQRHQEEAHQ